MTRSDTDLHDLSLVALAGQLRQRKVSALETAQHFLQRAKAHDALGVYVARDEDVTLAQARAADQRLASGSAAARSSSTGIARAIPMLPTCSGRRTGRSRWS